MFRKYKEFLSYKNDNSTSYESKHIKTYRDIPSYGLVDTQPVACSNNICSSDLKIKLPFASTIVKHKSIDKRSIDLQRKILSFLEPKEIGNFLSTSKFGLWNNRHKILAMQGGSLMLKFLQIEAKINSITNTMDQITNTILGKYSKHESLVQIIACISRHEYEDARWWGRLPEPNGVVMVLISLFIVVPFALSIALGPTLLFVMLQFPYSENEESAKLKNTALGLTTSFVIIGLPAFALNMLPHKSLRELISEHEVLHNKIALLSTELCEIETELHEKLYKNNLKNRFN